jgi:hypothetical protein
MMPPANSTIDIVVWASLGDTTLTVGQRLRLTGTQKYLDSQLNIMTDSAITGGSGMETTEKHVTARCTTWPTMIRLSGAGIMISF